MKKLLSVALSVCVLLCTVPFSVSADSPKPNLTTKDYLTYELNTISKEATLVYCDSSLTSIVVPDYITVDDSKDTKAGTNPCAVEDDDNVMEDPFVPYNVVTIACEAFADCTSVKTLYIGKNLRNIEKPESFTDLTSLTSIIVDEKNKTFSSNKGLLCSKDGKTLIACPVAYGDWVEIPENTQTIGGKAFFGNKVLSITFPNSLTTIENNAFQNSDVQSVNAKGVQSVGEEAFFWCSKLKEVRFGENLKSVGTRAFQNCAELLYVDLSEAEGVSVGGNAFFNCPSLMFATVGRGVTIGKLAFSYYYDEVNVFKRTTFTICGYKDTDAETIADSKIKFADITEGKLQVDIGKSTPTSCKTPGTVVVKNENTGAEDSYTIPSVSHQYRWVEVSKATCEQNAKQQQICSICNTKGETQDVPNTKLNHVYVEEVLEKNTCTKAGIYRKTCRRCNKYEDESLPALGHDFSKVDSQPTSATQVGYTKLSCTRCSSYKLENVRVSGMKVPKLSSRNTGAIKIALTKVNGASGYDVYESVTKKHYKVTSTTLTVTGLSPAKAYSFKVRAYAKDSAGTVVYGPYSSYLKTGTLPKPTKVTKLSPASKAFTAKWSKVSGVSGYQVQYATNSKFTNGKVTVTVTGASTLTKKITGLSKSKKYYVRVRSYKTYNSVKNCSSWSAVKSVVTK